MVDRPMGLLAVILMLLGMPGRTESVPDGTHLEIAGRLREHVRVLAEQIGERNAWNLKGLEEAASYIENGFAGAGLSTSRHPYLIEGGEFWPGSAEYANLVGEVTGDDLAGEIIIVGAHYDSVRGSPGADDNASAVAVMLELARAFGKNKSRRTLRFVAFVNEEPPFFRTSLMGSRVYAKECKRRQERIVAMLSLEMLGFYSKEPGSQKYPPFLSWFYPDTADFIAVVGNLPSRSLVKELVREMKAGGGVPVESISTFELVPGVDLSDHASFWKYGYPAAMITDTAFYRSPFYHTSLDTPETLDYSRMAEVVAALTGWIELKTK